MIVRGDVSLHKVTRDAKLGSLGLAAPGGGGGEHGPAAGTVPNVTSLKRMRQFYRAFPEGSALPVDLGGSEIGAAVRHQSLAHVRPLFPPILSWTHYRLLLTVEKPEARSFYEIEAVRGAWSAREFEQAILDRLEEFLLEMGKGSEARTIGIVLCSEKNDAMVRITLPDDNAQVLAAADRDLSSGAPACR